MVSLPMIRFYRKQHDQYLIGFCIGLMFLLGVGCKSSSRLSNENLTTQLFYQSETFSPDFQVYHKNIDSSYVYFSIDANDLLFVNDGTTFSSQLRIEYSLFDSYSLAVPSDTGSYSCKFLSATDKVQIRDSFFVDMNLIEGKILQLKFEDVNRRTVALRRSVIVDKSKLSNQSFIVSGSQREILYNDILPGANRISLQTDFPGAEALWVRCYFRDFPLASLPFRVIDDVKFSMYSDSVFYIYKSDFDSIQIRRPGIYYFQADTNLSSGLALVCMDPDFPKVTKPEQLIEATRYLTTKKEYAQLMGVPNKKSELDAFWLDVGGSAERARGLIRAYYNRVQDANRAFTSYIEGWKTDRGMIYLILGQPISVYRDAETEQWTYSGLTGFPEMLFIFRKMNNPFSDNDYALIRQPVYENVWYLAVDHWRQGRIVNDN
jgi:GWxTD domain-containing protein